MRRPNSIWRGAPSEYTPVPTPTRSTLCPVLVRRRLGHITKQGSSLLRFLLVEAAQVTVRSQAEWRSQYFHLVLRRGRKIAKVAIARRLAIRLYWMWRQGWDYEQCSKFGSHAGQPGHRDGVQLNTE
jgi:transposase